DISNLINYLNNSDWVLKGKEYLKTSNDNCPFCQQKVSEKFKNDIEDFFDKTFDDKINELSGVKESYLLYGSHVFSTLEKYLGHKENYYISMEKLSALGNEFKEIFNYNIDLIDNKISEPTIIIKLKSTHSTVEKINSTIKNCNDAVENYNLTIDNIQPLRDMITKQCWRYLYEKSKDLIDVNIKQTQIDRSIIIKLDAKINNIKKFINESKIKISNLEGSIKSIVPTKEFINDMLSNFGFTNFKLTESEESGFYKIIRDDGHHVANTLSEGEKTFITFLYFLGMVQGAVGEGFITEDKVVVIDDPISSLDSNVLFIVSTLIRNIINKVRGNESDVKQILLLTHNIYFHKEVTYNGGKELKDNETFWIVRKDKNKNSIVKNYKDNPIKTSYQLLWNEVKQENISVSSLQNVMRRILENYFKMFGNIDINNLADKFEGDDKFLCRSLISWVHDGSHSLQDDLFIDSGEIARESYSVIFKNIFYSNGHQAHYDMMMRLNGHIHDA
ncbi:AAA family ATPase, partial [Yersinia enterocolitica]